MSERRERKAPFSLFPMTNFISRLSPFRVACNTGAGDIAMPWLRFGLQTSAWMLSAISRSHYFSEHSYLVRRTTGPSRGGPWASRRSLDRLLTTRRWKAHSPPCVVRWPRTHSLPRTSVEEIIHEVDLFPTLGCGRRRPTLVPKDRPSNGREPVAVPSRASRRNPPQTVLSILNGANLIQARAVKLADWSSTTHFTNRSPRYVPGRLGCSTVRSDPRENRISRTPPLGGERHEQDRRGFRSDRVSLYLPSRCRRPRPTHPVPPKRD